MKSVSKRGSEVPKAPEETHAPEFPWATAREPAPAGALQRAYSGSYSPVDDEVDEAPYVPVRGKVRFRLRGILRTVAGRVVFGVIVFVVLSGVAVAAVFTRSYLLHDARFVIPASANIETVGNTHLTRAQVLSVFGEDVERNIFKVPLAQRRADLERLPWVQHATVMRLLPNTLRVSVVERMPVAFVRQGSWIGLVDSSGVLLDIPADAPGDPHYSFPVLTGISANDPLSTRAARMEIYGRFMKELDSSGEKVTDTLSEVDVSSPEDVKALIPSGSKDILVHFGDTDFLKRYRHFQEYLPDWKRQYADLASADMRYDREVVLEMAQGKGVPSTDIVASNPKDVVQPVAKAENRVVTTAMKTPVPKPAKAAEKPVAKAPVPPVVRAQQRPVAKPVSAAVPKKSAANEKMFAALAAARQQQKTESGQVPR
jgi:cell division protein FtsQ